MTISPKFNVREIMSKTIERDWINFQSGAFDMGKRLHTYMQTYINSHRKRRGGTGNLSKSVNFETLAGAGMGSIFWGIGNINLLPAYYYVINYGKMITGEPFIPFRGQRVPGSFEGGRPKSGLRGGVERFNRGDGSGFSMKPGSVVRPMNYIQATRARLNANLNALLLRLKAGR